MNELYRKYRPTSFAQVVGQDDAVRTLVGFGKRKTVPHCLLFTGPSGCGKTTLARILKDKMRCGDADYSEMNTADFRGIDMVREIRERVRLAPMSGDVRIWLVDECHKLTNDAQNAFLKLLEDPPDHAYFMLATTEPHKLLKTIATRATEIQLKPLRSKDMAGLVASVAGKEGVELDQDVLDKIVDLAEGSPRKALVLLNQALQADDAEQAMAMLVAGASEQDAIELARLMLKPKIGWPDVVKVMKGVEGLEGQAEGIRRMMLRYMTSVALGGGRQAARAVDVIDCFRDPYYDMGVAGLVQSCWEACHGSGG